MSISSDAKAWPSLCTQTVFESPPSTTVLTRESRPAYRLTLSKRDLTHSFHFPEIPPHFFTAALLSVSPFQGGWDHFFFLPDPPERRAPRLMKCVPLYRWPPHPPSPPRQSDPTGFYLTHGTPRFPIPKISFPTGFPPPPEDCSFPASQPGRSEFHPFYRDPRPMSLARDLLYFSAILRSAC